MNQRQRSSYSWITLHQQFLTSEHISVASFLRSKDINPATGNALRQTKGWAAERQELGREALEATQERLAEDIQAATAKMTDDAVKVANNVFPMFVEGMRRRGMSPHQRKASTIPWLTVHEFTSLLKVIRIQLGLNNTPKNDQPMAETQTLADLMRELADKDKAQSLKSG